MSPAKRLGIDKTMRLRRRADFLAVQQAGTKIHGRSFLALVVPTSGQVGRLGVTVTRRVGNAVTRNRIKRLVREWMRQNGWVPAGCDVVSAPFWTGEYARHHRRRLAYALWGILAKRLL